LLNYLKIAISLIEAVVTLEPLDITQKPTAACHGKQLKLHDQGGAVFAAHKQMISAGPSWLTERDLI
jgi:hypothetical protein